jgi:glycerate-2-kinase
MVSFTTTMTKMTKMTQITKITKITTPSSLLLSSLTPILPSHCVPSSLSLTSQGVLRLYDSRARSSSTALECNSVEYNMLEYKLNSYKRLSVIGLGKAGLTMALSFGSSLREMSSDNGVLLPRFECFVITKTSHCTSNMIALGETLYDAFHCKESTHPVPEPVNVSNTAELLDYASVHGDASHGDASHGDASHGNASRCLTIVLLSGGTSSLLTSPLPPLALNDLAKLTSLLLKSGHDINTVNRVRSWCDAIKGGGLVNHILKGGRVATGAATGGGGAAAAAAAAAACDVATLVLSDVTTDDFNAIGSGPTYINTNAPNATSAATSDASDTSGSAQMSDVEICEEVIEMLKDEGSEVLKNFFYDKLVSLNADIDADADADADTTITTTTVLPSGYSVPLIIGNNRSCVDYIVEALKTEEVDGVKYKGMAMPDMMQGDVKDWVATVMVSVKEYSKDGEDGESGENVALVYGGETTVTFDSSSGVEYGVGGRNQELALRFAIELHNDVELRKRVDVTIGTFATDGGDGDYDGAGGIVDGGTVERVYESYVNSSYINSDHDGKGFENCLELAEDYLRRHDSYSYFALGGNGAENGHIVIGPTGSNVADVMCVFIRFKDA